LKKTGTVKYKKMYCTLSDGNDVDFVMSVQHHLQALEVESDVVKNDDRWDSAPKARTPGRWLSDSSISVSSKSKVEPPRRPRISQREPGRWVSDSNLLVNYKSQDDPPRQPQKNDAEPMTFDDSRWKSNIGNPPSALIPVQPKRRKSIAKLVDDHQCTILSLNCHQLPTVSCHQDLNSPHRQPNIHAAFSA
jgi:hypothetical protein